jgi:hypothetical protein
MPAYKREGPELRLVHDLDKGKRRQLDKARGREFEGSGLDAEKFLIDLYTMISDYDVRFSTEDEDKGLEEGGQAVDVVLSSKDKEKKPIFATQITTDSRKDVIDQKLKELTLKPFVTIIDHNKKSHSVPKTLVLFAPDEFQKFRDDPKRTILKYPGLIKKAIENNLFSLNYDLGRTLSPKEQDAVKKLIEFFENEKKKYTGNDKK